MRAGEGEQQATGAEEHGGERENDPRPEPIHHDAPAEGGQAERHHRRRVDQVEPQVLGLALRGEVNKTLI